MDKFDRIFQLHAIFSARRTPIPFDELKERLQCSRATIFRALDALKDSLGAPICFDTERGGYLYGSTANGRAYELPGLWFNAEELQALVILQRVAATLSTGLLEDQLAPLGKRLAELTAHRRLHLGEVAKRIRLPALAARPVGPAFQNAAAATLQRRQLGFRYHSRGKDEQTERTVSPQRVTHYRESWYLDAWDEQRRGLRSFAVDRISAARILEIQAIDVDEAALDEHYASAYGIFGGRANKIAVLIFSAERARWVADEKWHPEQRGQFLVDGRYELRIPYRDPRELLMDVLRHGAEVEVLEPQALRKALIERLRAALQRYDKP